jgi:hypothetical protein
MTSHKRETRMLCALCGRLHTQREAAVPPLREMAMCQCHMDVVGVSTLCPAHHAYRRQYVSHNCGAVESENFHFQLRSTFVQHPPAGAPNLTQTTHSLGRCTSLNISRRQSMASSSCMLKVADRAFTRICRALPPARRPQSNFKL